MQGSDLEMRQQRSAHVEASVLNFLHQQLWLQ